MLLNAALVAVLGAIGASAANPHAIRRSLELRQLSASDIPSACQSQCQSAITVYEACQNNDLNTCLSICSPDTFGEYRDCLECILDNNPQAGASNIQAVNQVLDSLEQLCASAGSTVSVPDFTVGGGGVGAGGSTIGASSISGGALTSIGGAISSAAATTGPRSGDDTLSGMGSSVKPTGSATGAGSSGAAGSQSSAAANTSGAAGVAASLPNMAGFAVALVGVVAGAAVVF